MAVALSRTAPDTVILTPKQIAGLAERRVGAYAGRNSLYAILATYYNGEQGKGKGGYSVLPMNGIGKPLLRPLGASTQAARSYSSNRLAPVVDDYQALLGRTPNVRVDVPDSSEAAEAKAEQLTKYLYSTYEASAMDQQQSEAGHWLACFGDYMYVEGVEFESKRVNLSTVDPRFCYPSFKRGARRHEINNVIVAENWSEEDITDEFGVDLSNYGDSFAVVTYLSRWQRTMVLIDGEDGTAKMNLAHVEWNLENCPAQWVFNKSNGQMAQSDIGQALTQQDFLDFAQNVQADALVHMVYPIIGLKNVPSMEEGDLEVGPGATVDLGETGEIQVHPSQHNPQALSMVIEQTINDMIASTGTSEVRQQGEVKGSIITGRAIHAMQGPQGTRIDLKRQVMASAIRAANSAILDMQENAPLLGDKEFEIYGRYKGKSFRETMTGKDIDGWRRTTVTFDDLVGMNQQQRVAIGFEGIQAGLWDDLTAMDMAGIDDPIGMRDRITAMKAWQARTAQEAQAAMQPPSATMQMNAGAGGAATPQDTFKPDPSDASQMAIRRPANLMAAALGQAPGGGGPPGSPPGGSPMPAQPPVGIPQGVPGGTPMGTSQSAVRSALAAVASKLKGTVFALGDLATKGQADKLKLAISDKRDYAVVTQAIATFDPKPNIKVIGEEKMPSEAVRVA